MDILEAIKTRRSIRRYKPDSVNDELLETVLEAGRWAPSWANTQCWRFIVVRNPEIKAKLAESLINVILTDEPRDNPGARAINTAPVTIVACAKMGKSGYHYGGNETITDKGDWYMFDVALAAQNMVLAAHSLGLGTVIIGAFDAIRVAETLDLPDGYRVVTLIPLGIPDHRGKAPPRKELSEIVFHDKWGK